MLDADLAAAFDRIDHDHLLASSSARSPPGDQVAQWLKAGVIENGRFAPTEEGTPQGGVVSPVLLNVALHGMETGRRGPLPHDRHACRGRRCRAPRSLIRYADDLVALCHSRQQAEQVKARLAAWLAPRGLAFNEDKTRIVTPRRGLRLPGVQRPPLSAASC